MQKQNSHPEANDKDRLKESNKDETRVPPLEDKSKKEGEEADTITVDENYPGPKESDIGNAEKPGIKGHEDVDHGES